jgi:acyl-[acyl-carrier-protein]-phospholipid O-acyltransferase / long-chain-fatty-acid--[acyl-carrier-protein] ligase
VTSCMSAVLDTLLQAANSQGVPGIMVPRRILKLPRLPRLGSGKINYPAVQLLVEDSLRG